MKDKGPILVLLLVAVGMGIALIVVKKGASDQQEEATRSLTTASNTIVSAKKQVGELLVVNQTLETNLAAARADFSNKLALTDANLRDVEANLEKATAEAKTARAQADSNAVALAQRDQKISELDNQNAALDKDAAALHVAITNLNVRIADTEGKLARSEGDRDFLLRELKVLRSEKEDMEKRFNDITSVREQLHKLKTEASITRRLERTRRDIDETFKEKGADLLTSPAPSGPPPTGSGATVELRQGGGVIIQTPPTTNAPPK